MAKKILQVGGVLAAPFTGGASLALTGAASFLGKKKKKAATPEPTVTPPTMPLADDEAVARARKDAIIRQRARGGRSSTILTDGDVLGGY